MIDWNQVRTLQEEVGAEDFQEILTLFLSEVDEVTERLANSPTPPTIEEDLHFLKGSAQNLGFTAFYDLCQKGETLAAHGRADQVDLRRILSSFEVSRQTFLAALPEAFDTQTSL